MTYIFDEEPERWQALLSDLAIDEASATAKGLLGADAASNGRR